MGDATRKETFSITGSWLPKEVSARERVAATAIKSAARIPGTRKGFTRPSVAATKDVPKLAVSVPEFHVGPEIALLGCGGARPGAPAVYCLEELELLDSAAPS